MDKQYLVCQWVYGVDFVVSQLEVQGVCQVFGIFGVKIDKVFDLLLDFLICIILVCYEVNVVFMVVVVGCIIGKVGVVLVIFGLGCFNLIIGMVIVNSEGDLVVVLGGVVKCVDKVKQVYQSMDMVVMFSLVIKYVVEVMVLDVLVEVVFNVFCVVEQGWLGSVFVSLLQDVVDGLVSGKVLLVSGVLQMGVVLDDVIDQVVKFIVQVKNLIFLFGLMVSQLENSVVLCCLLEISYILVISIYQVVGVVNQDNFFCFVGWVGLFNNQVGDCLLQFVDLVICIGYSLVEYELVMWNSGNVMLVYIDVLFVYEECNYILDVELVGDIVGIFNKLV